MKVAFDENVPIAMVRVFEALASQNQIQALVRDLEVFSAKDFTPRPGDADYSPRNDAPWVRRFAASGGRVIISGNTRMQRVPHERLAMVHAGMVVLFFEAKWNNLRFFPKCAILLQWWPEVAKIVRDAEAPSFWRIPASLDPKHAVQRFSHDDQALLRIERQKAEQPKKAAERAAKGSKSPLSSAPLLEYNTDIPAE